MSDALPQGWATARIEQVLADIQPGFASGEKNVEGGIAHLRMNNIGLNGNLMLDLVRTVPEKLAKPQHDLKRGDVIVCTTNSGKLVGKCAYFDLPGRYAFSNHLTRLRPKSTVMDGDFLRWNLWLQWKLGTFDDKCKHWVNQSTIPKDALLETGVVVPPLAEQHRIVAKLEMLLGKVDACEKRLAKIPVILKRFRQAILAAACSGRLTADWREKNTLPLTPSPQGRGKKVDTLRAPSPLEGEGWGEGDELPEGWDDMELGALIHDIQNGLSRRSSSSGKDTVVLRLADIVNQRISLSKQRAIKLSTNEIEKYKLQESDVLVVRVNGSAQLVGNFILYDRVDDWTYCDHLIRMRVNESVIVPKFLIYLSRTDVVRKHINDNMVSSAGQNTVSQTTIKSIPIPLPHLPEQQEIVRRVDALFKKADEIEARYNRAKSFVDRLNQSILAKAFRGELVPQDPNDEPASVLLEKIKTEKGRLEEEKKKG